MDIDATDSKQREGGEDLLADICLRPAMAHLYRGEIYRTKFWGGR